MGRREELGARIRDAVDRHSNNASHNEMAQAFFGMDVAAYEGTEPYTVGVVQGWMYGTIFPTLDTLRAMANAAGFQETMTGLRWLVFGNDYAQHAVEPEEYAQYYDAKRVLLSNVRQVG